MTGTTKALPIAVLVLLTGLIGACGGPTGKEQKLSRERDLIQQQLTEAKQETEAARTEITVLKSKLTTLKAAATAEPAVAPASGTASEIAETAEPAETAAGLEQALGQIAALTVARDAVMADLAGSREAEQAAQQRVTRVEAELADARHSLEQAAEPRVVAQPSTPDDTIARQSALQEQLIAVQADKAALETRLAELDAQVTGVEGETQATASRVAMLEQSLGEARTRSKSLAEQVAAMHADAETGQAHYLTQSQELEQVRQRVQAAMDENQALRGQVEAVYQERDDEANDKAAMATEAERRKAEADALRAHLTDVGADPEALLSVDEMMAEAAQRELDYQALLEEGQALLNACTAGLGHSTQQVQLLEQRATVLKQSLQRQYRGATERVRALSAENRHLRGLIARKVSRVR